MQLRKKNKINKQIWGVSLLAAATLVASLPQQVFAGSKRSVSVTTKPVKQEKVLTGKVTAVDGDRRQFKVQESGADRGLHTINISSTTTITGTAKTLKEIEVGDTIAVRFSYWTIETKSSMGKTGLLDWHPISISALSIEVNPEPNQSNGKGPAKPKGKRK